MEGAFGMVAGELLAIDVPPGPLWIDLVQRCWAAGVAFLPLDARLTDGERRRLTDLARPAAVLDGSGELTVFADPPTVDHGIALVMATSGTAGSPKLVELARGAVEAAVACSLAVLDDEATWVSVLPPAHVGGLLVLLRAEITGARVDVRERFDPGAVAAAARSGAHVALVPAMVSRLIATELPLDGLTLLVGGGALDPALAMAARDRGARVVTTYGLTETCGGVVYDGRVLGGTRLRIEDEGAIELRGPTLMAGYRHDPAATGAAFSTDGWLRTGDVGGLSDEGRLVVAGRTDDVIRTGGEKVWPAEVEGVLIRHPKVSEVAVAGAPHPEWGQQVVAYVVPTDVADPPTLQALRDWTEDHIARFKAPRELILVAELPRTPSGKVRRASLPPT